MNNIKEAVLKKLLKEALIEVLEERRDLLLDVVEEALDGYEMIEDIREFSTAEAIARAGLFTATRGEA